ncbi:MAG: YfhO family protein [Oscillospiraceae bacterium]|nr:YfhO family protein [Oscillospiraceae bacterium]
MTLLSSHPSRPRRALPPDPGKQLRTGGGFLARQRKPWQVYLVAFLLPTLIMGILWIINKVTPFGSRMILAHDQWHQYYPFYLDLRDRLRNGDSLLHSWTTGMGTSYLPLFAYYLASPLNYLAALLPDKLAMVYYTAMVLLRLGLAGMFFAIFLRKTFDRSELTLSFFSAMYALCAFLMGYYWNAIWLDTVALLPLVVLGTFSLLKDGKYMLYMSSLALSVFCSYYIGLFTCIFVLLIFIGWHIVNWDDLGGFGLRLLKFFVFTVVALGMTAVLTIPAYLGLQSTSSAVNKFPEDNALNIVKNESVSTEEAMQALSRGSLAELYHFFGKEPPTGSPDTTVKVSWIGTSGAFRALKHGYVGEFFRSFRMPMTAMRSVLANTADGVTPTSMEGLPNVACGFTTLILALLYLFCKKIPLKERIVMVLLLFFFGLSFILRTLDYIWHGFHFPNMLPHRFSFLWSFVVIFMAYRAYTQLETLRWWRVALMVIPLVLILICVCRTTKEARVLVPTIAVSLVLTALLLLHSLKLLPKTVLVWGLCILMFCEGVLSAICGVAQVGTTDGASYPYKGADVKAMVAVMKDREADSLDLWRAELATKHTLNDSTLFNFNGVSVFSSAANSRISAFLQSIGLAASVAGNRYSYQEADPFTNLLLGVKYLIDRQGRHVDPEYFEQVDQSGSVLLLENKAYLPMGFVVHEAAANYTPEVKSLPYDQLNLLFKQMTGREEPLFDPFYSSSVEALGTAELTRSGSTSFTCKSGPDENNCVQVTFRMPYTGHLCIYSKSTNAKDLVWYLNGVRQYTYSDKYGYNRYMGIFDAGDEISLRYIAGKGTSYYATFGAAVFRSDRFDAAYEDLSRNGLMLTNLTDTLIEGAVQLNEPGLVYTSIPYDNGWTLTIDGKPAKITPVGDAMIAFRAEPGLHMIRLEFETPGFSLGAKISLICTVAFLLLLALSLLLRFRQPPIVKVRMKLADPRTDLPEALPPAEEQPLPPGSGSAPTVTMPPLEASELRDLPTPPSAEPAPKPALPEQESLGDEELDRLVASFLSPEASQAPAQSPAPAAPAADEPAPASPLPEAPPMTADTTPLPERSLPAPPPPDSGEEVYSLEELDRLLKGEKPEGN